MPKRTHAFTLIELILVFAIIGILASLAVSTYQTYVVRSQVSEALLMAAAAKGPIEAAFVNDDMAPADRVAAGMTPDPIDSSGAYISRLDISDGRIDVTFGGPRAHADIVGDTLSLTPYRTSANAVVWRCGNAAVPPGATLLPGGADHRPATVESRYLPKPCRPQARFSGTNP